jgi:hypothetical protein
MGNEVTKSDLQAVNKRIDNASKAFTELRKEFETENSRLTDGINNVAQASMNNLSSHTAPLEKRLAALEARVAALEKK